MHRVHVQRPPAPRVRFAAQAGAHPIARAFAELLHELLAAASPRAAANAGASSERKGGGLGGGVGGGVDGGMVAGGASDRRRSMGGCSSAGGSLSSRIARRPTLLILERSFDPLTPLLHDFSYEALAEGLGVLARGRFVRPNGKAVLLHDSDPIWADLRRRPWVDVADRLNEHSRHFLDENEAIVRLERGDQLTQAQKSEALRSQMRFGFVKRRDGLRTMQEVVEAVTRKLRAADGSKTDLYAQLSLEQDLATGKSADGRELGHRDAIARTIRRLEAMRTAEREAELRAASSAEAMRTRAEALAIAAAKATAEAASGGGAADSASNAVAAGGHVSAAAANAPAAAAATCARATYTPADAERCRLTTLLATARQLSDSDVSEALSAAGLPSDAYLPIARTQVYMGLPPHSRLRAPPADGRRRRNRGVWRLLVPAASSSPPLCLPLTLANPHSHPDPHPTPCPPLPPLPLLAPPCPSLPLLAPPCPSLPLLAPPCPSLPLLAPPCPPCLPPLPPRATPCAPAPRSNGSPPACTARATAQGTAPHCARPVRRRSQPHPVPICRWRRRGGRDCRSFGSPPSASSAAHRVGSAGGGGGGGEGIGDGGVAALSDVAQI